MKWSWLSRVEMIGITVRFRVPARVCQGTISNMGPVGESEDLTGILRKFMIPIDLWLRMEQSKTVKEQYDKVCQMPTPYNGYFTSW